MSDDNLGISAPFMQDHGSWEGYMIHNRLILLTLTVYFKGKSHKFSSIYRVPHTHSVRLLGQIRCVYGGLKTAHPISFVLKQASSIFDKNMSNVQS